MEVSARPSGRSGKLYHVSAGAKGERRGAGAPNCGARCGVPRRLSHIV